MPDIDTKKLRRLMEEATPGPWSVWANYGAPMVRVSGYDDRTVTSGMYRIDATLIVAMHNALPALLSEAEEAKRLREELAALRAAPPAPEADGWVLVPREPTEAMNDAARDWSAEKYGKPIGKDASEGCYRAMLAAAPTEAGR